MFFMPSVSQCDFPEIFLFRFIEGRFGPSNTKRGSTGMLSNLEHRKKRVLSSGFSPSRPYVA